MLFDCVNLKRIAIRCYMDYKTVQKIYKKLNKRCKKNFTENLHMGRKIL